ncbi:MAG: class I SAM-dependent methyltransferase [Promethearchaeota archaeon]|jgi:ubiquinone/menaquinone biosynthesis C-methylase UbiE
MVDKKFKVDPKKRFSSRVDNYIKYRPNYPQEIITFLKKQGILLNDSVIADVGSGTGILSEMFLKERNSVIGIEPNPDMRKAGEKLLKNYQNFTSINGSAESTGLDDKSVNLVTAGQAFHWFDLKKTKIEFKRILRPNGFVIIIWNNRRKSGNNFSCDYEKLMRKYGTDYNLVRKSETNIEDFYNYKKKMFFNYQKLDYSGLKGRLLSASYIPLDNDPGFNEMITELKKVFEENQKDGYVKIEYDTEVNYGNFK